MQSLKGCPRPVRNNRAILVQKKVIVTTMNQQSLGTNEKNLFNFLIGKRSWGYGT